MEEGYGSSGVEEAKLLDLFDEGYQLYQSVSSCEEPTNSVCIQTKIKQAMKILEDATRLTSIAGIFSSNESVDEVATDNLKLFLLPGLLGTLALKLTVQNRIEVVETAEIYFRDFMQRCNDYGITNVRIQPPEDLTPEELDKVFSSKTCFDLAGAARLRASKIQRYHEEKALEQEVKELEKALKAEHVEEETKRDYYLKLIRSLACKGEEELDCLLSEKRILTHLKNVKKEEPVEEPRRRPKHGPRPRPLQPVILTKDHVQKAVFGAGYPSLPTMTVQEFYQQRVQEGIFPTASQASAMSLQQMAAMENSRASEESEEAEKESKIETDDPETLARMRNMDEFKDDHKRGYGNRYNRS